MDSLAVAFLGVIALASLVQAGFLIGLAVHGRRLSRRVEELQQRIDRDLQPTLTSLARVTRNAAEISDLAVIEVRRMDLMLASLTDRVDEASRLAHRLVLAPLRPVAEVAALLRGVRRGVDVYYKLRHFARPGRSERRRSRRDDDGDDEHLFI